jgi:hypothetical protein|tara:strand:- start:38657 stop:39040 length:384 start_codon:yes stop_codon:yes gene_type:complete
MNKAQKFLLKNECDDLRLKDAQKVENWIYVSDMMERYQREQVKKLTTPVVMPRRLTAENGAKALLIGEFFEEHECSYYDSDGELVEYIEKVPVSWGTIKEIYKKVAAHYAINELKRTNNTTKRLKRL